MNIDFSAQNPIVDEKELKLFDELTYKYRENSGSGVFSKITSRVVEAMPENVKDYGRYLKNNITKNDIYKKGRVIASDGFQILEEKTADYAVSRTEILKQLNLNSQTKIENISQACLLRGYDVFKVVNSQKQQNITYAFVEGGATGVLGFGGIPFNLVLSTFLFYKAVQTIAMYYGYDVKNDSRELIISGLVFMNVLSEGETENETTLLINKFMAINCENGFSSVNGGDSYAIKLLNDIKFLAVEDVEINNTQKSRKTLEERSFKEIYEQIGKKLAKLVVGKSIPIFSFAVGAVFDSIQMEKILDYANTFYCKRFIVEKEKRIKALMN